MIRAKYDIKEFYTLRHSLVTRANGPVGVDYEYEIHKLLFDLVHYTANLVSDGEGLIKGSVTLELPIASNVTEFTLIVAAMELPFEKIPLYLSHEAVVVKIVLAFRLERGI